MKTKIGLSLLLGILFHLNLSAQEIIGEQWLCVGDCADYIVVDANGDIINEDFEWGFPDGQSLTGPQVVWCPWWAGGLITASLNGVTIAEFEFFGTDCCSFIEIEGPSELCVGECGYYIATGQGGGGPYDWQVSNGEFLQNGEWCPTFPGVYDIIVTDFNGCSFAMGVTVVEIGDVNIISTSGAFCTDDGASDCEKVCENTTVVYTTEVNTPGIPINWSVSGAENWEADGNEVTVEWGTAGQGQVSLEVGDIGAPPIYVLCSQLSDVDPSTNIATFEIYVQGPNGSGPYYVDLNNGQMEFITGEGSNTWGAPLGTNIITVTDDFGNTASCMLEIVESNCIYIRATPSNFSLCEFCEAGIEISVNPLPGQGSPGPFTYTWSTSPQQNSASIFGLCEGVYTVTVTDDNNCTGELTIPISCGNSSACSGSDALCVDILELPEALFETNPPAINNVIEICEGQTVFFDNLTNGGFNYTWDFGTGISSSLVDAEHTYLSAGTYEAILIARNDCFCSDSSSVTIIVEQAITPEIDCAGTICPGEEITYTSNADCSEFYWNISPNGIIISGGSTSDDFITVDWGAGPEGIIELSVGGCNGDYCVQTLIETIPIIDDNAEIRGPERVCKGAEVIYSMPAFAGTEFVWGVSSFGTITEGQGTNEITVKWVDFVTTQTQQVTVDYESCYLGCGGSDVLNVNILNEIFIEGSILACPGGQTNYTCQTPLGNFVQANWTVLNNIGTVVASSAGVTPSFDVDWNFGTGNYTVHAEVLNPTSYCIDNFSVFIEVVSPTPQPSGISGEMEICPGTSYTYTGSSGPGSYDYTWYITDGVSNYSLNGKTVNVIWGASPPYVLELTQTNLDGFACESAPISASPAVISNVVLNGTPEVCDEGMGTYTATVFPNLDYTWQVIPADAGSIISGDETNEVEIQWHTPGDWEVRVLVCGVSDIFPVRVNPLPTPTPVFNPVCPGQTGPVSLTEVYPSVEWKNEFGTTVSNAPVPNLASGYYEVIVTDDNGCTGNETFFIGTYGQPDVTISTPDFGNFCANGGSMTLYALESSSGPLDYQWHHNGTPFGSNSSAQVISQEGSYYVLVTDINGCTDFSNTLGLSCADLPGPPSVCVPDGFAAFEMSAGVFCNQSEYTNTSVNDVDNTWSWQFVDVVGGGTTTSSLENPTKTWTNAGFNIVIFTVGIKGVVPGEVCMRSVVQFDTIPLVANYVFEGTCVGEPISFTDISTYIPQTNIAAWAWDFDDPASGASNTSSLQNPQHVFNNSGFYTVSLTTTDLSGCISVSQQVVEIVDPPLASFSIPMASCEGASLPFSANGNFTDILWDFGDANSGAANTSTIANTNHVYVNPGTYTVSLTVENVYGCSETVSQEVVIEPNDLSGTISVMPALEVCEGDSVILTAPVSFSYDWSNGSQNQSITVFDAGEYEVTIFDSIGCGRTLPSVVIDLIPLPQGEISAIEYNEYDQPSGVFYDSYETCFGEDVYLTISEDPNYTYEWPNGETSTEISFTDEKDNLLSVGTHEFEVEIVDQTTGCTNTVGVFTVTVHPVPENVIITSMPAAPVCENTPTVISIVNPDPDFTYIWNTGELGTSINTFYAGKYFARAINQFGCEGESNTLEIVPGPNLDLIPSGCHTRCNPDTICLPPIFGVASFQWYLDGTAIPAPEGNDPNYIATESGEYHVEMVSDDGCVSISDILTLDLYDGFGLVEGDVYFDLNNSGTIDAGDTLMPGIDIILQQNGINIDTLTSNQIGSFAWANIVSMDYTVIVDGANLPGGMVAIISQAPANLFGCDDEEMVEFLIQFICPNISETLGLAACPDGTVDYNGTALSVGDVQDFIFSTSTGCDSTVTVIVGPLPEHTESLELEACENGSVDYNGTELLAGSVTDFTYANEFDCDSVVTVTVLTLSPSTNDIELQACTGSTVEYDGTDLPPGSITDFTFTNSVNCDSVVTVTVVETDQDSSSIQLATCIGSTIDYNGTDLAPGSQTDFMFSNSGGCDSIVTVIVNPLEIYSMTENLETCAGDSIDYNGVFLMAGETMTFNYATVDNCDSTVLVMVAALESSSIDISFQACTGSTIDYNGTPLPPGSITDFAFTNSVNCDSIVTVTVIETDQDSSSIQLATCIGSTIEYNGTDLAPGSQTDFMFLNSNDCDSIVTVIVNELQIYNETENLSACVGELVNYNGTDIPAGSTMTFTYTTIENCDSIVTVIVDTLSESTNAISLQACPGSTVDFNGTALPPGSIMDFTFNNESGCDSIVTVTVDTLSESTNAISLEACLGSTVDFNGTSLPPGTVMDFTFDNESGCDSIVTVTVDTLSESTNTVSLQACTGSTVDYNGTALSGGTVTDFTFDNSVGCDSVVTVTVIETDQDSSSIQLASCLGSTVDYNGTDLDPNTETDFMFTNTQGCDSIVTVIVDALESYSMTENLAACTGQTVDYNGTALMAGSSTTFNFTSVDNCDSTVTVVVAELMESIGDVQLQACENGTVDYNGTNLPAGSTTDFTYSNSMGCDSVVTVVVEELMNTASDLDLEACLGSTVIYDGVPLDPGTSTDFTYSNAAGCDSVVTVAVAELPLYNFDLELSACEGGIVEYNGEELAAGSVSQHVFTSVAGCDSTMTVSVATIFETSETLNVSACDGSTYPINGENIPAGSSIEFIFTNAAGCDSILTVNVAAFDITETFIDFSVCAGETMEYNGDELTAGFSGVYTLTDQNGCDSLVNVGVAAYPVFDFDVYADGTCWNADDGTITIENLNGGVGPFLYSVDGINYQDSVSFENLNGGAFEVYVVDGNGCEEILETEIYEIPPLNISAEIPEVPCDFSPVVLELENISGDVGPITYVWNDGSTGPFMPVDTPGVFAVEISNACEVLQEQYTVPFADGGRRTFFYAPNLFSPNGDGMNDVWQVMPPNGVEVLSFELHLFDRWGNHLKTFNTVDDSWDGNLKNKAMNPGVYVWWYKATVLKCGVASEMLRKGDVTIVK